MGTWPSPPKTSSRVNPNSRFSVGLKLTFCPKMYGPTGNSWPASAPKKLSASNGPRNFDSSGIFVGIGAIDLQHPEGRSIVAHQQGAAFARPPPHALLANREVEPGILHQGVRVLKNELIGRDRRGRLHRILIDIGDHLPHRQRIGRNRGRVLIFAVDVKGETPDRGAAAEAGDVVEALPDRAGRNR